MSSLKVPRAGFEPASSGEISRTTPSFFFKKKKKKNCYSVIFYIELSMKVNVVSLCFAFIDEAEQNLCSALFRINLTYSTV